MTDVLLRLLDEELGAPKYARDGDAGIDLMARHSAVIAPRGGRSLVATGVAIALPESHAGLVIPRSGLAAHHGVTCLNTPGLIDAGYRGEIKVVLVNTDPDSPYSVSRGDRIAQLVVVELPKVRLLEVDQLPESSRGEGGFGHSGR